MQIFHSEYVSYLQEMPFKLCFLDHFYKLYKTFRLHLENIWRMKE